MIKKKIINEIIKNDGFISLEEFIYYCLFDSEGYYKNIEPLGKSGDFVTAPEVSQLFGEIIGLHIYNIWEKKINRNFNLIELGPGNGTLMIDILRVTKKFNDFHKYANINLIEKNKYLINKQKKNLNTSNFDNLKISWNSDFELRNNNYSIIIANEFFDCFPVRHFKKNKGKWKEKYVSYNSIEDKFYYKELFINKSEDLIKLENHKENDTVELSEKREAYFKKICQHISKVSGTIIISDYGYFNYPGYFTIKSFYNNISANLLDNPGKQDITSDVDFKKLIEIAKNFDLKIDSYTTQKGFLIENGINIRKEKILKNCSKKQVRNFNNGYEKLIDDNEMGLIYKFLVITSE